MNLKNKILSANAKIEAKFDSLSKISETILIFGQLFLLLIFVKYIAYAAWISSDSRVSLTIFSSVRLLFENAASGLFILWLTAIFIDYIEKKRGN